MMQSFISKATAAIPEDDKFDLNVSSAQKFLDLIWRDANNFGWGKLVRAIPEANENVTKNLLIDHKILIKVHIKKRVYKTWGNHVAVLATPVPAGYDLEAIDPANELNHCPAFFRRVRSRMVAKRIMGHLKTADLENRKKNIQQSDIHSCRIG